MLSYNFIFLGGAWDSLKRRNRQLVTQLASRNNVKNAIFIQGPLPLSSLVKYVFKKTTFLAQENWKRMLSQRGLVSKENDVWVVNPVGLLPNYSSAFWQHINCFTEHWTTRILLRNLMKNLNFDLPTVVFYGNSVYNTEIVRAIKPDLVGYDCTEDYGEFYLSFGKAGNRYRENDWEIKKVADVITTVSEKYCEKLKKNNLCTYWLPNAVDFAPYQNDPLPEPPEIQNLNSPIIGYVGFLTYRHDVKVIKTLAEKHPSWSIVIIGRGDDAANTELRVCKNVYFLGMKTYDQIPAYLKRFTVNIIPYLLRYLNETNDPIKLYQYLAAGKPIVSYDLGWLRRFSEVVSIAKNSEEFVLLVEESVKQSDDKKFYKRIELAKQNNWSVRADELNKIIVDHLSKK